MAEGSGPIPTNKLASVNLSQLKLAKNLRELEAMYMSGKAEKIQEDQNENDKNDNFEFNQRNKFF